MVLEVLVKNLDKTNGIIFNAQYYVYFIDLIPSIYFKYCEKYENVDNCSIISPESQNNYLLELRKKLYNKSITYEQVSDIMKPLLILLVGNYMAFVKKYLFTHPTQHQEVKEKDANHFSSCKQEIIDGIFFHGESKYKLSYYALKNILNTPINSKCNTNGDFFYCKKDKCTTLDNQLDELLKNSASWYKCDDFKTYYIPDFNLEEFKGLAKIFKFNILLAIKSPNSSELEIQYILEHKNIDVIFTIVFMVFPVPETDRCIYQALKIDGINSSMTVGSTEH